MKIGYARVSTSSQDTSLQIDALNAAGCEIIYKEKASGSKKDRPELEQCLKSLRKADTLVVWKLDRLGRSLQHLLEVINDLENKGIGFTSLTESIDTTTSTGKLVFNIFGSLAEFE
ncbi:DNA invertase, partial [Methylococcaceae bacterium CS5]